MIQRLSVLLLSMTLLTGCAPAMSSAPWVYSQSAIDKIVVGQTTQDDAKAILGEPRQVHTMPDGKITLIWSELPTKQIDYSTSGKRPKSINLLFDHGVVSNKTGFGETGMFWK